MKLAGALKTTIKWIFCILLCSLLAHEAYSQKKKTLKSSGVLRVNDTISTYSRSDLFNFPNVNKVPYYYNESKLKQIRKLEEEKGWISLYPLLRSYVKNFGVVNFYRDTHWIWRLAKLTEIYGNYDEAKLLYKLVLKHHREDIDIRSIELYYDSLTTNDKDYYVPLEYYYELVDYRKEVDTLRPPRSVLLNMGQLVNSDLSDYGPTLSSSDKTLIFTSKRNSHHRGIDPVHDEDLFYTQLSHGNWGQAKEFKELNTQYNEGSASLSRDGKTLFFARCNSPDSYGDCDIFTATLGADSTWGKVKNLGVNVNSIAWDSHPSLSHSEDTLYFASDRIGGFGLSDIYYTTRDKDGNWTKAVNMGPIINTRNSEVSPFYHHVFNVLYFSSNGQSLNFGEFDIYKSYKDNGNWAEPKNIGPLVNGPGSEFYFTIDSRSENLYYSRSVENNMSNLDLYSFPVPMEAQPGATTKVGGSLTNEENGEPFKGIVSIIDLDNGIEVAPKFLRPDGSFEFDLINNNNYLLIIQGEEFFRIEELFYLDGEMQLHKQTSPISSKLKFESLEFEEGKAALTSPMYGDLDKMADFLLDNPGFKLRISGHTDSAGREDFNLKLSQDRADIIKEYLVFFGGVEDFRITAQGFGSSKPIVKEVTEADKRLNRRVEFEIYRDKLEE
ncbi:Outer membrane lipoprotein omp16 precursor [Fulvivirga imtechensis AK7]|uniref:Outer membrane lipoprotein omp16 n=1 Tax=Fulvivirga imtechensis AK7 TaxID=1237149 RepID=L8JZX3_9BACT|nr:OmpA family protein [Fulvivirga imtechensis]ELR72742.1 Outer membrane lipoprotein omp16 precursor [Fulvivirga imtechensis AK7]